jgi:hypothetical protein
MLYTPIPGTPLHREMTAKGLMKPESELGLPDIHGQLTFNYRHPQIDGEQATAFLARAFERDFAVNGPSTVRIARTRLLGWARYKNHPDARVRRRYEWEARELATTYSALTAAAATISGGPDPRAKLAPIAARASLGARLKSARRGDRRALAAPKPPRRALDAGASREPPTFTSAMPPAWTTRGDAGAGSWSPASVRGFQLWADPRSGASSSATKTSLGPSHSGRRCLVRSWS